MIVTNEPGTPRPAWATFDRQHWLLVDDDDVSDVLDRLRAAGIERVAVMSRRRRPTSRGTSAPGCASWPSTPGPSPSDGRLAPSPRKAWLITWHIVAVDLG